MLTERQAEVLKECARLVEEVRKQTRAESVTIIAGRAHVRYAERPANPPDMSEYVDTPTGGVWTECGITCTYNLISRGPSAPLERAERWLAKDIEDRRARLAPLGFDPDAEGRKQ